MWVRLCVLAVVSGVTMAANIENLQSQYRVPGEYHVVLQPVDAQTNKASYVEQVTSKVKAVSDKLTVPRHFIFSKLIILVVHCPEETIVQQLFDLPEVKSIEANLNQPAIESIEACSSQSSGSYLWGLSRIASRSQPNYNGAQYQYTSTDGSGTYAYVVDSGIYTGHQDFYGRAIWGYSAQNLISEGQYDYVGHGTHCAGTIMSYTYGVAKSATAIAIKVINRNGYYSGTDFLDGVNWMYYDFVSKKNSQGSYYKAVASMSLGGGASNTNDAAVQECINAGLPVIVAAGNNNQNACSYSPARMSQAVTVGATDSSDSLASFSNHGSCVNVLAPGVNTVSTYIGGPTATASMSGTSMATPHVAGAVLRYMSQLGYRPSPAYISSWIYNYGTWNVIYLRGQTSTANNLLYAPCTMPGQESIVNGHQLSERRHHHPDFPRPTPTADVDTPELDNKPSHNQDELNEMKQQVELTYYLAIASVVLLTLTLLATVSVCCRTVSQSEAVKSARQQWYLSNMVHNKNKLGSKELNIP